ncbi:hypothetical protein [Pseudescherichia sp.]|uniref:hypothetical protein n=1 Tax=Pseudescherichia sp. TaxID=2055881 RepID=UPI00289A11ED|nr:hypothetical protein [Pseudescherichia sp.]
MVASGSGQTLNSNRQARYGQHATDSDRLTAKISSFLIRKLEFTDVANDTVGGFAASFHQQVMAYKEAKPQTFVRIIVPVAARVM